MKREKIESTGRLSEVARNKLLDRETMKEVKEDIREASEKTLERLRISEFMRKR